MKEFNISLPRVAYFLISLTIFIYFLIKTQFIFAPMAFGMLFAFMLKPLCDLFERYLKSRIIAITLSFIAVFIPFIFGMFLIVSELINIIRDMPSLTGRFQDLINRGFNRLDGMFHLEYNNANEWLNQSVAGIIDQPIAYLGEGLSSSTSLLLNISLAAIYTFLMLLYRTAIKNFFLVQFDNYYRRDAREFLERAQDLTQKYLYGIGLVILILGTLNSAGLWLLGIKYALFWGFLASCLAVIPYIGTMIGGLLPTLYALATTETIWIPLGVVVIFVVVQFLEGNLITPKVIGSSVKINPLAALISLIIGSAIWGLAGLVLALPYIAIFKVICDYVEVLKPVGLLLSSDLYKREDDFRTKFNENRFRLLTMFKRVR